VRKSIGNCILAGAGILALGIATPALAQGGNGDDPGGTAYWMGRSGPHTAACPTVEWNVTPTQRGVAGPFKGVAFFSDMRGISKISGTIAADGSIAATLTSVSGNGPAGTVDGKQEKDVTKLALHGLDCSNASFSMRRWSNAGGGGG
jgi:hypothetical protein